MIDARDMDPPPHGTVNAEDVTQPTMQLIRCDNSPDVIIDAALSLVLYGWS